MVGKYKTKAVVICSSNAENKKALIRSSMSSIGESAVIKDITDPADPNNGKCVAIVEDHGPDSE
jgi:hypothetical protein